MSRIGHGEIFKRFRLLANGRGDGRFKSQEFPRILEVIS